MPTLLVEQPWIVGTIGTIVSLVTLYGWLQTGNANALRAGVGLAILTIVLVLFNIWTVSDSEVIENWVSDVARELQSNQVDKVSARIHPQASDRVMARKQLLNQIRFSALRVTKIHSIEVKKIGAFHGATVRMNVFAEGSLSGMEGKVARWISLQLEKAGEKWLVMDIEDQEPLHEFRN
jgi:hypothetical protein